jgi:hypothetical protein
MEYHEVNMKYSCEICKEKVKSKDLLFSSVDGEICEVCRDDYFVCEDCEICEHRDFSNEIEEKFNLVCDKCLEDNYFKCDNCGVSYSQYECLENYSGLEYCETCYYDLYSCCISCDTEVYLDQSYTNNEGETLCEHCYEDISKDVDLDSYNSLRMNTETDNTFSRNKFKRMCGVEIETVFLGEGDTNDTDQFNFNKTSDGSISGYGVEWVSAPMSGDRMFNEIDGICGWLNKNEYGVNRSCGLHVHIDARDLYWEELCGIMIVGNAAEETLYSMIPKSRETSNWCRKSKLTNEVLLGIKSNKDFTNSWYDYNGESPNLDKYNDSRYTGINMHARVYMGTVEFRHHSGTINPNKINNWITVCQSIVEKGIELGKLIKDNKQHHLFNSGSLSPSEFIKELGLEEIKDYIYSRINKFNEEDNILINSSNSYSSSSSSHQI